MKEKRKIKTCEECEECEEWKRNVRKKDVVNFVGAQFLIKHNYLLEEVKHLLPVYHVIQFIGFNIFSLILN